MGYIEKEKKYFFIVYIPSNRNHRKSFYFIFILKKKKVFSYFKNRFAYTRSTNKNSVSKAHK